MSKDKKKNEWESVTDEDIEAVLKHEFKKQIKEGNVETTESGAKKVSILGGMVTLII